MSTNNRFDFLELGADGEPSKPSDTNAEGASEAKQNSPKERAIRPTRSARGSSPTRQTPYEPILGADDQERRALNPRLTTIREEAKPRAERRYDAAKGYIEICAVEVFGTRGGTAGQFNFPAGIAVDFSGILFVADVYNHRVQRITPDGGVSIIGTRGSGRTQFLAPSAVAVDPERSFYVVEQGNNRVQKFRSDGVLELVFGREGGKPGEFRAPMGIFVSPASREILVADTGNGRVQRFNPGGQYLGSLGAPGSIHPPLANPQAVTCDQAGNIYVADSPANRIARYDPLGRFLGHFGGPTSSKSVAHAPELRLNEPHALACDLRGDLYIADGTTGPGRIVVISTQTGAVRAIVEDPGRGLGPMSRPGGVALSQRYQSSYNDGIPRTDMYLADTMNHRIVRFTCS